MSMKISTILDDIDSRDIALPEFQRGFVWKREQVRKLMNSLYRGYPVGSVLVWTTSPESAKVRGDGELPVGSVDLLLDGQQRITSLYGILRGRPPEFFQGDPAVFTGLHFHLRDETFEFYAPSKMKGDPLWIDVTELEAAGLGQFIASLNSDPNLKPHLVTYLSRLNAIDNIKKIQLHVDRVTGADKTVDVVVEIFNQVNSGGTKLSKGDLALAKVCAFWPEARREMMQKLKAWEEAGFFFKLEWLLRCVNTITTGEALFTALDGAGVTEIQSGLTRADKHVNTLLDLVASRLGLDHDRVLGSRYAFPLMARYLDQRGGPLFDLAEQDKLLYWFVNTLLWGRYSSSTESVLNQDLALIEEQEGALDRLIDQLRQNRGDLRLHPNDFTGWSRGARFYPMLYMLTRVCHARDWCSGKELSNHLLGHMSRLELHHVFPKSLLYKHGYSKAEANAIANFTFLTQECNLHVSNREPSEYLKQIVEKDPQLVKSHWIPLEPDLWRVENYLTFLEKRRELLAETANEFLDGLLAGTLAQPGEILSILAHPLPVIPGRVESDGEEQLIADCIGWMVQQKLPPGEYQYELVDEETGNSLAILDLAWPDGVQEEYSQPVALLIDEEDDTKDAVTQAGYRYFTSVEEFQAYVKQEILAMEVVTS